MAALQDVLRQARCEDLPPIAAEQIAGAPKRISARKARGVDDLSSADLLKIPARGREGPASILTDCEARGAWPRQVSTARGAALPNPNGSGDWIIGMPPTFCKLWSKARSAATGAWGDEQGRGGKGARRPFARPSAARARTSASSSSSA